MGGLGDLLRSWRHHYFCATHWERRDISRGYHNVTTTVIRFRCGASRDRIIAAVDEAEDQHLGSGLVVWRLVKHIQVACANVETHGVTTLLSDSIH